MPSGACSSAIVGCTTLTSMTYTEMLLSYTVHVQVKELLSVSTAGELAQVPEAVLRKHFGEKTAAIISEKAKGVSVCSILVRLCMLMGMQMLAVMSRMYRRGALHAPRRHVSLARYEIVAKCCVCCVGVSLVSKHLGM
jgi:hypothetical protein